MVVRRRIVHTGWLLLTLALVCCLPAAALDVKPGWPVWWLPGQIDAAPALVDLDHDGSLEIVVVCDAGSDTGKSGVYALRADTTTVAGWPQPANFAKGRGPVVVGDLEADGDVEVLVTAPADVAGSGFGGILAWHHDGTRVAGWPGSTDNPSLPLRAFTPPTLADLDGDGDLEVIAGADDGYVYAWHHTGAVVTGWPRQASGPVAFAPVVGDVDADSAPEVVTLSAPAPGYLPRAKSIDIWRADGTPLVSRYATGDWVEGGPALGDLNGDGWQEVAYTSDGGFAVGGSVHAFRVDGSWGFSAGYTLDSFKAPPVLADLDGDGDLEVEEASAYGNVYAWHAGGERVEGFAHQHADSVFLASPAVADLDGDGLPELITGYSDSVSIINPFL